MIWLVTGCGKVGDPHVPTVRTPAMIVDLKAVQNQDRITLYWTNPSKYTDGSNATDLMSVRILQAGKLSQPKWFPALGSLSRNSLMSYLRAQRRFIHWKWKRGAAKCPHFQ